MQYVFKMEMVNLGLLNMKEHTIDAPEGLRACQDYGKAIGQMFS